MRVKCSFCYMESGFLTTMAVNCHFVVYFGLVFLYSTVADITVHPQEDFNTAQADCSGRGLSLPVAETYEEYELLLQYLNDNNINTNVWLGLKVPDGETRFKWVNDGYKEGGYLQTEWADDEPNNLDVPESCVRLKSDDHFKWNTRDCTKESEFICVNYSKSDTDFELFTTQKNYGEARQFCQGRSKDLPMLKTRNQYDLILDKINTDSSIKNIWIGMMFVGSQDDDYREFKWFDGERIDTADWDTSASGSCVYMDSSDSFKWKPVSCSTARSYVCTPTFRIHSSQGIVSRVKFKRIGDNKEPYSEPLGVFEVRSPRECCIKCAQLTSCYIATAINKKCKLFKYSDLSIYKQVIGSRAWKTVP